MRRAVVILPALALLAACGKAGDLERPPGMGAPPVAYGASKPESAAQMIKPSVQARPRRSNDLLSKSELREIDKFDLPPGVAQVPFPGDPITSDLDGEGETRDPDTDHEGA